MAVMSSQLLVLVAVVFSYLCMSNISAMRQLIIHFVEDQVLNLPESDPQFLDEWKIGAQSLNLGAAGITLRHMPAPPLSLLPVLLCPLRPYSITCTLKTHLDYILLTV